MVNKVVRVNGREWKNVLFIIDTLSETASITTLTEPERQLDLNKCYVEVNIYGNIRKMQEN
jgi:hypothetical protein